MLRERIMRRLETLPDDQIYQVLDFIEFLEAKYAESELRKEASGLQKFGERLEDSLRRRTVSPGVLREAFHVIAAADRVLSGVASAGKDLLGDLDGSSGSESRSEGTASSSSRSDAPTSRDPGARSGAPGSGEEGDGPESSTRPRTGGESGRGGERPGGSPPRS
ncbi:MAG: DUF2281 domain-containing protein [Longimicrobiales bacterium]|nr:DUF2281 domain-containing protein [Longimicrobiales bacterium]